MFRTWPCGGQSMDIPATIAFARDSARSTGIERDGVILDTVEHILAALYGLGIDNTVVTCDGPELPILDGSACCVVESLEAAGIEEQDAPARVCVLREPVFVSLGEAHAMAVPSDCLRITVASEFRAPVGRSCIRVVVDPTTFKRELAGARTPGFIEEWQPLKDAGLVKGADRTNVLLVLESDFGVTPRWPDEAGRHKALDLVGDLALIGARLKADVTTVFGGHGLNRKLVRTLQGLVAIGERDDGDHAD